jgi:hypothetical protein
MVIFNLNWFSSQTMTKIYVIQNSFSVNSCYLKSDHNSTYFLLLLFSWRYNPSWLYFRSPVAGFSLLVFKVS